MEYKFIEIRDAATTIPALAIKFSGPLSERQREMLQRAGYGEEGVSEYVVLMKLDGLEARDDPYDWKSGARTMFIAHACLLGHLFTRGVAELVPARADQVSFYSLGPEGGLIDVEYVLGLKDEVKSSEFGG